MAKSQFLVRNRHNNMYYGRVVVPLSLRERFAGKRELRLSLGTADKKLAKKLAMRFWVQCQSGFEQLTELPTRKNRFETGRAFLLGLEPTNNASNQTDMELPGIHFFIRLTDLFGRVHEIDLNDPEKEKEVALELQNNAAELLEKYKDHPEILDRLLQIQDRNSTPNTTANDAQPETVAPFDQTVTEYITKLRAQGRKGKKLAERTLLNYQGRLEFWQSYFKARPFHEITQKELNDIQLMLIRLPVNYSKQGFSTAQAIKRAKDQDSEHQIISDKTRAEYLAQLKGILEYAYSCGYITKDLSPHIEIPNTKLTKSITRLPFSDDDLRKIFPGKDYGVDFGIQRTGLDNDTKFWFPLLAAFTGARLEEIGQLKSSDIKTCPDTGILYANIADSGAAADGTKKRTKTKSSVRPIPIHSTLVDIGFLNYVAERKKDKDNKSLFKLNRDKQGRLAKSVSNWFSRMDKRQNSGFILGYIERRGVESKGVDDAGDRWSKSFHSFRHSAIDNLRGKKLANGEYIREPDIGLVMGHEKDKVETASYGEDRSQLELRNAVIQAISYTDVDFPNIRWVNNLK